MHWFYFQELTLTWWLQRVQDVTVNRAESTQIVECAHKMSPDRLIVNTTDSDISHRESGVTNHRIILVVQIPQGQRHTWGVVGSLVIVLLQVFSWFWQWNNFENRLIFDELKAYKNGPFWGHPVNLAVNGKQNTALCITAKIDDTRRHSSFHAPHAGNETRQHTHRGKWTPSSTHPSLHFSPGLLPRRN